MENGSLIIFLQISVRKISKLRNSCIKIYLFGSALNSAQHRDIDLLIVYDEKVINMEAILNFRNRLKNDYYKLFRKTLDICLLTKNEDKNNPFRKEENAKLLIG